MSRQRSEHVCYASGLSMRRPAFARNVNKRKEDKLPGGVVLWGERRSASAGEEILRSVPLRSNTGGTDANAHNTYCK